MDGVIADFVGAIHKAHGRPYCYDDPAVRGRFDIDPIWGISAKEFWSTDTFEFWDTVEPHAEATQIVSLLEETFGSENVCILTSPSNGPGCVPGKRSWIRRHFPQFQKRIIFTSAKEFLAGDQRLLIDDRDSNIKDFRDHGGEAILIPRHWNLLHRHADRVMEVLQRKIAYATS